MATQIFNIFVCGHHDTSLATSLLGSKDTFVFTNACCGHGDCANTDASWFADKTAHTADFHFQTDSFKGRAAKLMASAKQALKQFDDCGPLSASEISAATQSTEVASLLQAEQRTSALNDFLNTALLNKLIKSMDNFADKHARRPFLVTTRDMANSILSDNAAKVDALHDAVGKLQQVARAAFLKTLSVDCALADILGQR